MGSQRHVWFTPDSDRTADIADGPVRANRRRRGPRSAAFSTLWLDSRKIRTAVLLERYADEAG
jgi:hypothetical protein